MSIFMLPPQLVERDHRACPIGPTGAACVTAPSNKRANPMIKSIGLLTRKDGLSHEEFVEHWLEIHAPLAHAVPGVRRYVQSHILEERTRSAISTAAVEI